MSEGTKAQGRLSWRSPHHRRAATARPLRHQGPVPAAKRPSDSETPSAPHLQEAAAATPLPSCPPAPSEARSGASSRFCPTQAYGLSQLTFLPFVGRTSEN